MTITSAPLKRRISLSEIDREAGSHVYVYNRATEKYRQKAVVLIPQQKPDGTSDSIPVPATWIPYDLSECIPKDMLLNNMIFMRLVAQGVLELVRTAEAQTILDTPAAMAEAERIRASSLVIPDPNSGPGEFLAQPAPGPLPQPAPGQLADVAEGVQPVLVDLMSRDDIDDGARLGNLRVLAETLGAKDLEYVQAHSNDEGISQFVANKLREVKGR